MFMNFICKTIIPAFGWKKKKKHLFELILKFLLN